jgi:hypothetical protein
VGATFVIAAVSFSAYLIGSFVELNPQQLVVFGASSGFSIRLPGLSYLFGGRPLSLSAAVDLDRLAAEKGIPTQYSEAVRSEVIEEMPQLATRLHVKSAEIYGRYDRLVAEGTFRLNVAVPLTFFLAVITSGSSLQWWWRLLLGAFAVLFGLLLAQQGMRRVVAARDVIVQAISIPDLGLESRRLSDFRWRLDSMRTVSAALHRPGRRVSEDNLRIRSTIVKILRDRQDLASSLKNNLANPPSEDLASLDDDTLVDLLAAAMYEVNLRLNKHIRVNPSTIYAVDQVLHQLDEARTSESAQTPVTEYGRSNRV